MTNMGACCVVALLLLAAPAWVGATLRGMVVRDREQGTPVAGVELSAPGANPVTTGNDGQFVLVFPQGHPGQNVAVRVSLAGWAVVNDVLLDRQLPVALPPRIARPSVPSASVAARSALRVVSLSSSPGLPMISGMPNLSARMSSAEAQRDVSVSLNRLGNVAVQAGDLAGARARFEEDLAIARKLAKDNPSSAEAERDLLVSLVKLGQLIHDRVLVTDALTIARELERTGRLAPRDRGLPDAIIGILDSLP